MRRTLREHLQDRHPFFWVIVGAAVIGVCSWAVAGTMLYKYLGMSGIGYEVDDQLRITRIYPSGPAEGKLQVGDVILAINDGSVTREGLRQARQSLRIGTTYRLRIQRNGIKQQVELQVRLHRSPTPPEWSPIILISLTSLCCLLVAIFAGLLRSSDSNVRHFFVAYYCFGQNLIVLLLRFPSVLFNDGEKFTWNIFNIFFGPFLAFPVLFHLFLRFPPDIRKSRFWDVMKWVFYITGIGLHITSIFSLWSTRPLYISPIPLYFILSVFPAIVLVVIRNYRIVTAPEQRKRIKWIIVSMATASVAYLVMMATLQIPFPFVRERITPPLTLLTWLLILGIPISWTYAILKHRVLDISVVIRRSVRYLLASRGFILIEALLAFAILGFLFAGRIGVWLDRFGSNTRTLIIIIGTVLMVLGLQYVNRKVHPLIERRFFREAYDVQKILTELTSSLRTTTNVRQVLELTTKIIQQALYSSNVTIFLRNGQRDFSSVVSADYHERDKYSQSIERDLYLPETAFVVRQIHETDQPTEIDWDDPYSPVATQLAAMAKGDGAAQQEFSTLHDVKANLVLPLAAKNELLGVLSLGPRAGDLPYSREDKRMLMNVAGQAAMAIENTRLIEQKIELESENERRAKELEEARQLQLSMLPKKLPQLPYLDIAAYMKTASEVGGDYYDFHVAEDGTLTIAVGDATGHGLKAGTLVSSVKSLFVSLAYHPDIPHIFHRISRVLKEMKLRGLFMAMTMVKVKDNQMAVSIAGMPSVLIYRALTGKVDEIAMRALPLGGLTNYQYSQQELALSSGDVVVLMSDGLLERFNRENEMFGEDRIKQALANLSHQSPQEIIEHLIGLGDQWAAGRPQDDDITFVVLKT